MHKNILHIDYCTRSSSNIFFWLGTSYVTFYWKKFPWKWKHCPDLKFLFQFAPANLNKNHAMYFMLYTYAHAQFSFFTRVRGFWITRISTVVHKNHQNEWLSNAVWRFGEILRRVQSKDSSENQINRRISHVYNVYWHYPIWLLSTGWNIPIQFVLIWLYFVCRILHFGR